MSSTIVPCALDAARNPSPHTTVLDESRRVKMEITLGAMLNRIEFLVHKEIDDEGDLMSFVYRKQVQKTTNY